MKKKPFCPASDSDPAVSILDSCVRLCDLLVEGSDGAAGLKYDEENMLVPMIVMLEKGASALSLIQAAENSGVPVVKNIMLAKNLLGCGKAGEAIPQAAFRDVSLVLSRYGSRGSRRPRELVKRCRVNPVKITRPLSVELGESLFTLTGEEPGREKLLADPLDAMRKRLGRLLGFAVPLFRVSRNSRLRDDEYRILFRGLEAGRGKLELGWYPKGTSAYPEIMNAPENLRAAAKAAAMVVIRHVGEIIQRRAPELLGRDEVEAILDAAEEKFPVVTGEVKNLLPLGIIREILQGLVSEQVSIRHIAVILETLADWGSYGTVSSDVIIEQIRQSLKRQICLEYADDRLTLRVLTLEAKLEQGFANHASVSGPDSDSSFHPGDSWETVVSSAVRGMEEKGFPPVILCSPRARSFVKEATRRRLPGLAVLSYMEIPPDISVEPLGEIRLEGNVRFCKYPNEK